MTWLHKGPFKYYVSKIVGGWGWPNAYVCLRGGWVGVERYLRNQKNQFFYQCSEKGWTNSKILVRTLYNAILRIARNFLETRALDP